MATIEFRGITVAYGSRGEPRAVLDGLDLTVRDGEFLVLVGPSGCGKTTALRVVAGLLRPTAGQVLLDGEDVTAVPPADRDLAMVFQSYALYPHMTVRDNMAFGLRLARVDRREREARVRRAAEILGLADLLDRRPRELSGGQRQRVAMGRAIVRNPRAFLMDEPLSNLDAKLRVRMRAEIARIQRDLGTTTLYVTHDQVEAMTMADRIAVLHDGRLQQLGTPDDLFRRPANVFVAAFIGSPPTNFLPAHVTTDAAPDEAGEGRGSVTALRIGDRLLPLPDELAVAAKAASSADLLVGIRPHDVETDPAAAGPGALRIDLAVDLVERLGTETLAHGEVATATTSGSAAAAAAALVGGEEALATAADRRRFTAALDARFPLTAPTTLSLYVPLDRLHLFDAETGATLLAAERSLVGA